MPLPVPFGSGIGREAHAVPQAKGHRLRQLARDHRIIGGAQPHGPAPTVTSNCCGPNSARNESGITPACRIAASSASPNSPWRR